MMKVLRVPYGHPDSPKLFCESLKNSGFAVVSNHPISHTLINEVFAEWAKWFQGEEKFKYVFDTKTQEGYFPFKTENAKGFKQKDLKEFFHLYVKTKTPSGLGPKTRELFDGMQALAKELLTWIQTSSPKEVSARFSMPLTDMTLNSEETLMRILHYPPLNDGHEEGAIRAAAHEDINLITLLPAATAPGLQVKDLNGNWISVECNPGDMVINAGDMLQEASGGYYISTTHQVVNPNGPEAKLPRYSMPVFIHPRFNVKLSDRYSAGSYLDQRLREIGLLKPNETKFTPLD